MPDFLYLSIKTPTEFTEAFKESQWKSTSFTVDYSYWDRTRVYIVRYVAFIQVNKSTVDDSSFSLLERYFVNELNKHGWYESEFYTPCGNYVPEFNTQPLLMENGFVTFRRSNFNPMINDQADFICLAIIPELNESSELLSGYDVVLSSVRPSFFFEINGTNIC